MEPKWQVFGYDTFSENRYPILPQHKFDTEVQARQAVKDKLAEIERDQPSEDSGNPDEVGSIQDTVILVHPDGTEECFNTNHILALSAAQKFSQEFEEEQHRTQMALADVMQFLSHDTSKTRRQLAEVLHQRAELIEAEVNIDQSFPEVLEIPTPLEIEDLAVGRIVKKRVPWFSWPFMLILQALTKKQSRFWHWGPLTEYIPHKPPYGMVGVGGDTNAIPRTGRWSTFWQTNFGWKRAVILKPKHWQGQYRIGYETLVNGTPVFEVCEMPIEGAVACLIGPSETDFFAVIKRSGEWDFTDLELVGITWKSRLPATVPLV